MNTQEVSRNDDRSIIVVVYNALAFKRSEVVPIPIESGGRYSVERLHGIPNNWSPVDSTLIPNVNYAKVSGAAQHILYFDANDLPPLGGSVFRVTKSEETIVRLPAVLHNAKESLNSRSAFSEDASVVLGNLRTNQKHSKYVSQSDDIIISNGVLSVAFDR